MNLLISSAAKNIAHISLSSDRIFFFFIFFGAVEVLSSMHGCALKTKTGN